MLQLLCAAEVFHWLRECASEANVPPRSVRASVLKSGTLSHYMIARTYPHASLLRPRVTLIFICDLRSREQASRQHAGLQPDHDT